jgi:hypothetical protein
MMRPGPASTIAALAVVLWATTASAECGWVLWKSQGRAYDSRKVVEDIDAFDTRAACVDALTKLEKTFREQGGWSRVSRSVETGLFADSGPMGQDREEIAYICRPVGMDLRQPKQ